MTKAIKDHLRDFLAIIGLVLVALVSTWIIVQNQRLRVPLLEEKPFQLKAEMETAQAVTPGQGQTVRVAGVRVGHWTAPDGSSGCTVILPRSPCLPALVRNLPPLAVTAPLP